MTLTMVSHGALAIDFHCEQRKKFSFDKPQPHLLRLNMDELSGTHYSMEQGYRMKIVEVREWELTKVQVSDLEVGIRSGRFGHRTLNRQSLMWGHLQCEIITDLEERLAAYRAEAKKNSATTQF